MAKVKITGHASGSGVLTITAPNTSTDRTITLPDATGTLATTDDNGSQLDHSGSKKIEAVSAGVTVTGTLSSAASSALNLQQNLNTTKNLYFSDTTLSTFDSQTGTVDLGRSVAKWKDLYLSGGLKVGGTGTANTLDDYEEGTWTINTSNLTTHGTIAITGTYTKIGNVVTVTAHQSQGQLSRSGTGGHLTGLPFNPKANTSATSIMSDGSPTQSVGIVVYGNGDYIYLAGAYSQDNIMFSVTYIV